MVVSAEQAWALFGTDVWVVLEAWPVLQIAVENSFRGAHSHEKTLCFRGAVQDYFIQNTDLEQDEVEDFLADNMSTEFDTVIEDESLPQMGQKQKDVKAMESQTVDQTNDDSDQEEEIDGGDEEMEVTDSRETPTLPYDAQTGPSSATSLAFLGHEAADDNWIVIQRKKK
ncbi:pre-rRNA-processing protein TSR2 homolog [Notamacropus eugenii]|uniref:pre-rRNA-processing protein TSR2 homolog n=1 Tax=Notamacropus eugenii TaxID=9315 RepID=UPI003B67BFAF